MSFTYSLIRTASLAFVAINLSLALPASAQNVLGNSGFETGTLDPWLLGPIYSYSGERWHTTSDSPHTGQFAATCTGDIGIVQTFAPIAASSITEVSFWEKQDTFGFPLSGSAAGLEFSDGTSNIDYNLRPTSEYAFYDLTYLATPGKTVVGFVLFGESAGKTLPRTYLDDVTILDNLAAPVPEASSVISFGLLLALGGVIVAARRKGATAAP